MVTSSNPPKDLECIKVKAPAEKITKIVSKIQ